MQVSRRDRIRQAVVVDEDNLAKLYQAISEFAAGHRVGIKCDCADKLKRHLNSLQELFAYENDARGQIIGLTVSFYESGRNASVEIQESISDNIAISIEGPSAEVESLSKSIDVRLESMRPAYARFTSWGMGFFVPAALLMLWSIGSLFLQVIGKIPKRAPVEISSPGVSLSVIVLVAGVIVLGVGIERLRKWLFPVVSFLIGQGKKRNDNLALWRNGVLGAFIVAVAAGVVVALIIPPA